ncbi:MAG: hypothetical protein OES20_12360 [Gammaproteobacteria bacterium]|nr:hypothetical protein [Gammaproteobacteria bacterium]MDH3856858.1 hypothetical protein [Gammaproteobacteria bacterium]
MKLVQKQLLKGTREFEIVDDVVNFRIKTPLKEEKLSIDLSILNPEPAVNEPFLEFHSRVKCGPLLSLLIDKPNSQEFNAFVEELKQRARQEYNAFAGLKAGSLPEGLAANVFEEPPEFDESEQVRIETKVKPVRVADIDIAIQMLGQHLDAEEIKSLLTALEALKAEPENELCFGQLAKEFDDMGPRQGAVLTYAPYVGILLSDDPFGF